MTKNELERLVRIAAEKAGYKIPSIIVGSNLGYSYQGSLIVESKGERFGDYSTTLALNFLLGTKKKPSQMAKKIIKCIPQNKIISKAEEKNGFINFYLSQDYLSQNVAEIIKESDNYGRNDERKGKKIQVEFVSANPTGPLHLGNARGGPLGDVIASILESTGAKVEREFYVNDIGNQAIHFGETLNYWQKKTAGEKVKFPEKGYPGAYLQEIAKKIPANDVTKLSQEGIELMLKEIKKSLEKIGIKYNQFVYESEILKSGKTAKIVETLKNTGETMVKEDAVWFVGKDKKFLKDRECVLVRSDKNKTPTYYADDLAYHQDKFDRGFDLVIDVWGSNHFGHIARMKEALESLGIKSRKLKILLYQYVRLKHGGKIERMAKREGIYVTCDQVLDTVGKDAFRMMMLMQSPNTHIDFDLELAKKESRENPVYYLQYACARIAGILRKCHSALDAESINKIDSRFRGNDKLIYDNKYESALIKELIKFPDLISEISHSFEVHHLSHYGISLAKKFHQFYKNCPVIKAETEQVKNSRLALIKATQIVLKNTLNLLGISAPDKM